MKKRHHCSCRPIIVIPYVPSRRRRKRRGSRAGTAAGIDQNTAVGAVSGLINIIIQIPVNAGDATALNKSDNNAVTNVV